MKSLVEKIQDYESYEISFWKNDSSYERPFVSNEYYVTNQSCDICIFYCEYDQSLYNSEFYSLYTLNFPFEISACVKKRQAEFFVGRYCARLAINQLSSFNQHSSEVLVGKDRSPVWPEGIRGSITHSSSRAACVVSAQDVDVYIGIDLETNLSEELAVLVRAFIHTDTELAVLTQKGVPDNIATTIIFSAKEALFKALYPKVQQYFGFECAKIKSVNMRKNFLIINIIDEFLGEHSVMQSYICYFFILDGFVLTLIHQSS